MRMMSTMGIRIHMGTWDWAGMIRMRMMHMGIESLYTTLLIDGWHGQAYSHARVFWY